MTASGAKREQLVGWAEEILSGVMLMRRKFSEQCLAGIVMEEGVGGIPLLALVEVGGEMERWWISRV